MTKLPYPNKQLLASSHALCSKALSNYYKVHIFNQISYTCSYSSAKSGVAGNLS